MNNYFFYEKNINFLNFFFKKKKSFIFKKHLKNESALNNKTFIQDDIYNFRDNANVAIKSVKILEEIQLSKYSSQNKLLANVLKRNLLINTEDILRTIHIYEKLKKKYKLDNFYVCKIFNDLELFNYLKSKKLITNQIKISTIYYIANKIYLLFENIYFFFNLILFPEKIFLLCRKNIKKEYNTIFNINEEPTEFENGYMYIRKKLKKSSLIVKDIQLRESFFKKNYGKNKNLNIFFLKNIFNNISLYSYLSIFYPKYFFERFKFILSFNNNYKEIYRYFCNKVCWEIFFNSFKVNKCLTAMLSGDLTSQYIQKKNSKETIFFYFSSTPNLSKMKNNLMGVDQIQYNFMNYSTLISNNISKNYLSKKLNYFDKCLDFGNLNSSLIVGYKNKINLLQKKFKIDNKIGIIGVFDNSIGFKGVLSSDEYLRYLKYLNYLVSKYKNYYFIFRKKSMLNFFTSETYNYKKLNIELKKLYNCKNFTDLDFKISTPEIIALSDVILSHPYSSIIYESLMARKTTIIFDNMEKKIISDYLYSEIDKKINIYNLKYKYRLLDSDILNILKINSKNSYKIIKNYKKNNFLYEVSKYLDN